MGNEIAVWDFILLGILLILSAFFSASETAFTSINKLKVRHMLDAGVKGAKHIAKILDNPNKMLTSILVGNNIVNITVTSIATTLCIHYLGDSGTGIAVIMTTIFILLFGEITPKTIANAFPEKFCIGVAVILRIIILLLTPFSFVFSKISDLLLILLGHKEKKKVSITEEELKTMVNVSQEEGVLETDEQEMILNVIEFNDTEVGKIMTPRTEIVGVDINAGYDEVYRVFKENQYSRIPVYQNSLDEIVGILHLKDLVLFDKDKNDYHNKNFMKEPYITLETLKVSDVFKKMKSSKCTMGIVLDEYGGTAGIVTIEDFVEEIVGDINDEYDEYDNKKISVIDENTILADGLAGISDINDKLGLNLSNDRFNTIGGFVTGELGKFPLKGDTLIYNENIEFVVESVEKNKVEKIRISKIHQQ
ncbi:MAG: HlyC/CorC family transporter [Spirochaetales bacterium]|nr:HlyC/CorC family transporter [Spirochaetales bacterium]